MEHLTSLVSDRRMSRTQYIRAIAIFTFIVGCLMTAGIYITYSWMPSWILLIGSFLGAVASIFVFKKSSEPVVSAFGVSTLGLCLGIMMGPAVATFAGDVVLQAVFTSLAIMVIMSILGISFPHLFLGIGAYLMAGLAAIIFTSFAQIFFIILGFEQALHMPLLNIVGILIFTGFVAYDWAEALNKPYTLDNAIDASGGLIIDLANLLLKLMIFFDDIKKGRIPRWR